MIKTGQVIPKGFCVIHKCDNPPCCNPDHLRLGTQGDNVNDMDSKQRRVSKNLVGESHGMSRLTSRDVTDIRCKYAFRELTQVQLAEKYKTTKTHISKICRRELWKHI
jgi:hypothetical protein